VVVSGGDEEEKGGVLDGDREEKEESCEPSKSGVLGP
jgi:hypothetical protein